MSKVVFRCSHCETRLKARSIRVISKSPRDVIFIDPCPECTDDTVQEEIRREEKAKREVEGGDDSR